MHFFPEASYAVLRERKRANNLWIFTAILSAGGQFLRILHNNWDVQDDISSNEFYKQMLSTASTASGGSSYAFTRLVRVKPFDIGIIKFITMPQKVMTSSYNSTRYWQIEYYPDKLSFPLFLYLQIVDYIHFIMFKKNISHYFISQKFMILYLEFHLNISYKIL